jgi:diguanylate cyclase (GGDEF)-like protein
MQPTQEQFRWPAAKPTILVVDDQPVNIMMMHEILKSDYEICMATSGREALFFCEARRPDLVLLDISMPEMSGFEVCNKLMKNELMQGIPVIFVTAKTDPMDEARGLEEGAVDFISKPAHEKVVLARVKTHLALKFQSEQLRSLAHLDGLTGIANRRAFDATLAAEWRRCMRSHSAVSVILIDIDFFKRYNDHYGHQAGDEALKSVAAALKDRLRRSHDMVARYGGEEFACILPETPAEGAYVKALELEAMIRELNIPHAQSNVAPVLTISLGAATMTPGEGENASELLAQADQQLYAAKNTGRGRVQSSYPPSGTDGARQLIYPSVA